MKAFKIGNQIVGRSVSGSQTVVGVPPLTLENASASPLTSWQIDGQSKQGRLPSGYTELEYIESSGTQYIMTGLFPGGTKLSAEVKFQASASAVSSSNYPCLFSCFTDESTKSTSNVYNFGIYNGKWRYKLLTNQGYGANADTSIHTIHWNKDDGTRLDSDTAWIASRVTVRSSNTLELPLFTRKANTGIVEEAFLSGKIYYAKFWNDSNALVRNFVPAKNSSDVVGMYDLVSGQFFTNSGTGSFTAGPSLVPSLSNPIEIKGVGDNRLPSGYKELEYIRSTGSGENFPYIDTLYIPTLTTKARVKFSPLAKNSIGFFGSRFDNENARFCCTTFTSGNYFAFAMTKTTWSNNNTTITLGNVYDCTAYNGKQIINGTEYTETTNSSFSTTHTFKLAPVDNAGTPTGGSGAVTSNTVDVKYYLCQIWENDVLAMDLVPCKNSSDVVGMYDLVSGQFFTNQGTGSFTAGEEVASVVVPVVVSDGTNSTTYNINLDTQIHKVGNYTDSIESDGTLTRACAVKVFDGTETFVSEGILDNCWTYTTRLEANTTFTDRTVLCTHFKNSSTLPSSANRQGYALLGKVSTGTQGKQAGKYVGFGATTAYPTLAEFKAFLASEYANGHPVTIVWYKATATETTVQVPTISTVAGTNYVDMDTEVKPSQMIATYTTGTGGVKILVVDD